MRRIGLYIHIPFRIYKHNVRNSLSFYNKDFYIKRYFESLRKELSLRKDDNFLIDSIYVGGGDPSAVGSDFITDLMVFINHIYNVEANCEKTIEVNPIIPDFRIDDYVEAGFNRFSLKIFTLNREGLENLEVSHNKQDIKRITKLIHKFGISNINADMFFLYPGQNLKMLREDLDDIVKFDFPHISYYSSRNDEDIDAIYYDKKDIENQDNLEADMLELIQEKLESSGYTQYEINHFEKDGRQSYHNRKYWNLEEYMGVGLGSSGLIGNRLYKNHIDFEKYFDSISNGEKPFLEKEELTNEEMEKNYIISRMGLREGLDIEFINKKFDIDFLSKYKSQLDKYCEDGLITKTENYIKFTDEGMYQSNKFFVDII